MQIWSRGSYLRKKRRCKSDVEIRDRKEGSGASTPLILLAQSSSASVQIHKVLGHTERKRGTKLVLGFMVLDVVRGVPRHVEAFPRMGVDLMSSVTGKENRARIES